MLRAQKWYIIVSKEGRIRNNDNSKGLMRRDYILYKENHHEGRVMKKSLYGRQARAKRNVLAGNPERKDLS